MKTPTLNDVQRQEVRQIEERTKQACIALQQLRTHGHFVGREQRVRAQYQVYGACMEALFPLLGEHRAIDRACQIYNAIVKG